MLLKEYFTDGLLQVAIVLSLLRTDFDLYFGARHLRQWQRPELQEILLGPHLGYTQTDFHSRTGHLYPKHIDYIRQEELLRDLHSLSDYRRFDRVETNINTWLVNGPEPQLPQVQIASPSQGTTSQPNTGLSAASVPHESPLPAPDEETGGRSFSAYFGTELTKEDMDLIDILWRQDIDLGISRDMFDTSLRQEQEKEYNKKLNSTEELVKKPSEQNATTENLPTTVAGAVGGNLSNYRIDNETGEMIPITPTYNTEDTTDDVQALWEQINILNGITTNNTQKTEVLDSKNTTDYNDTGDEFFDDYSTFQSTEAPADNLLDAELQAAGGLDLNEESWQDVLSLLSEQINQTSVVRGIFSNVVVPQQTSAAGMNQQDILADLDLLNISQTSADNVTRNSVLFSDVMAERSMEANNMWSSLDLNMSSQEPLLNNVSLVESLPIAFSTSSTMLPVNNTVSSFNNFSTSSHGLFLQTQPLMNDSVSSVSQPFSPIFSLSQSSTPTSNISALFSALTDNTLTNSTFSSSLLASQLSAASGNISNLPALNMSQPVTLAPYANNDTFIQHLLQNDLSDLTFDDSFGEDGTTLDYDGLNENWSTDSAVSSMHSPSEMRGAAGSSYRDDTSVDGLEELEGATGGSNSKEEIKYSEMMSYASYSDYDDHKPRIRNPSNSSSTNSSQPQYQPETVTPSRKHVAHNHTYYLQPGQKSREQKEEEARREREERSTRCKDAKRAQMMKIPLSIEEIIDLPVDQFTELLSRYTLSEAQHQLIRDIRRRGKNKAAAQNCRKRKLEVIQTLEDEVEGLRRERDFLKSGKTKLSSETLSMREKFARLQADMLRTLRDASGQQYNPDEYNLQLTSDGDIILVPRNTSSTSSHSNNGRQTSANLHDETDPRKRKPKRKD